MTKGLTILKIGLVLQFANQEDFYLLLIALFGMGIPQSRRAFANPLGGIYMTRTFPGTLGTECVQNARKALGVSQRDT